MYLATHIYVGLFKVINVLLYTQKKDVGKDICYIKISIAGVYKCEWMTAICVSCTCLYVWHEQHNNSSNNNIKLLSTTSSLSIYNNQTYIYTVSDYMYLFNRNFSSEKGLRAFNLEFFKNLQNFTF